MVFRIIIFFLIISLCGCSSKNIPFTDTTDNIDTYAVETDVSLTLERTHIIMNRYLDNEPGVNGIYSAEVGNPNREKILAGDTYGNPVAALSIGFMAYLDNGRLKYYDINSKIISSSAYTAPFTSLALINDSIVAGCRNDSLIIINRRTDSVVASIIGYDPTTYRKDTLVFITYVSSNTYELNKLCLSSDDKAAVSFVPLPLDTVTQTTPVRWFSLEPGLNHYTIASVNDTGYSVYSGKVEPITQLHYIIAEIDRDRPLILAYNLIIFPGADGRYYKSAFDGSDQYPYWGGYLK